MPNAAITIAVTQATIKLRMRASCMSSLPVELASGRDENREIKRIGGNRSENRAFPNSRSQSRLASLAVSRN